MDKFRFFQKAKKNSYWKKVFDKDWLDYRWQIKNRVTEPKILQKILYLTDKETKTIQRSLKILRMAITPYYLSQIDINDKFCPIKLQAVPTISETNISKSDFSDPLHEEEDCPVKGLEGVLTHRYPDRLIIYVTYQCAMYCRHCTRRRHAGETDLPTPWLKILKAAEYVKKTKTVRDILISGGDPLTLPTDYLEKIIKLFREIKHVEIIRIGTRVPVTCPMRITDDLCQMLKKYHPLWINTHFNHPKEITDLSAKACNLLADAGIPLGNQSVLLRRVNNHPLVMKNLVKLLVANRVRPYYIYQCDLSQGIEHFRTRVSEGIEIIEYLRGHTSGFAVPVFCIDGIGGGGKIPLMPNYVLSQGHSKWVLRNYEGLICNYTEPSNYTYEPPANIEKYIDPNDQKNIIGVSELLSDSNTINIVPKNLVRHQRRKK
ncbi:lysine 2,3-aminomutase [Candidatus Roizmanbacteria bacterium CG02_land_8_20_14_3_00_36_15]|uniref:L-lysine 2,3-aminomutase n=1 Tax=Candidatus Roizmanbacteria bacterium CG_4_9_14_0_2_um_filter_35_15 TaxID=1974836 RepID=A0A2M8F4R1_9BACT|nr:MAG: lysine 2,3-aminomutase [Candidatus Roizmanbacteria bacterium CG03_land_8_20_14_0_80_36_21]PIV37367.1 MAG: lysine 2,3-aminomutase [Candidatus Roizmanbacteria bacterium CG02_land_8_20_14_3_00_36_15]PJA52869.1 MAG: lysine 2,3-aminomutase [Candidatus Roizmanbacteria bacterium CG_4_9_14_3_um_filter_36_11]PJC34293.1 MAG: lysine 2,3-aminomutase [Candidatus Roizmanbacteria bacterium CG_4_9_14_0_2_um_filter_35_15]PJC82358.1 MAG: lysine 2,3-aminomutase [Candidatus Roizmanbacteria bacterium CG_4_8